MIKIAIFLLILFIPSIQVISADNKDDISNKLQDIKVQESNIELIKKKINLIEIKYKNLIEDAKKEIEIEQQRSSWRLNKLGIAFSTGSDSDAMAIKQKGLRRISDLERELEFELLDYKKEVSDIELNILDVKNDIEDIKNDNKKIDPDFKKLEIGTEKGNSEFQTYFTLGEKKYIRKQYSHANIFFETACNSDTNSEDLFNCNMLYGKGLEELGDYNKARNRYIVALENTNDKSDIRFLKEKISELKTDTEEKNYEKDTVYEEISEKNIEKANKVFLAIESKLISLSLEQKVVTYNIFIEKLNNFSGKSDDENLKNIISVIVEKMQLFIEENQNIESEIFKILGK